MLVAAIWETPLNANVGAVGYSDPLDGGNSSTTTGGEV